MHRLNGFFALAWALLSVTAVASPSPASERASIQEELTTALQVVAEAPAGQTPLFSQNDLGKIRGTQFIFVDGLFGSFLNKNFFPADGWLRKTQGVTDIHVIRPSSKITISETAELLYQKILAIRQLAPEKPAIITAHSKGAAEVLLMALRHPDLVTKLNVQAINILSGPIQGTPFGLLFEDCTGNEVICAHLQRINHLIGPLTLFVPKLVNGLFTQALNLLGPVQRGALASRIFYVRTQMSLTDVLSPLYVPHVLLSLRLHDARNDGVIPTANQLLIYDGEVFGTDLGVIIGDHNCLAYHTASPATLRYRQVFFQVLLRHDLH